MDEYIDYLYAEYNKVFGGVKTDDPIEITKEIFTEKLDEDQKNIFYKFLEQINKRKKETEKNILKYGFYCAKDLFK